MKVFILDRYGKKQALRLGDMPEPVPSPDDVLVEVEAAGLNLRRWRRNQRYKLNEPRRHKIPRARYRVQNWPEYDRALQRRGNLTVWVTPEALAAWRPPRAGRRGRPREYSDVAIETDHLLRLAFGRPWRQTEGLLRSIAGLLGLEVGVPGHTTFARRNPGLTLAAALARAQASGGPVQVVIDATGLKVYGAGEWLVEQHGARGRREWRKLASFQLLNRLRWAGCRRLP